MKHQRRIAVINDVTGFGRCSVTVALPILSAMRLETCIVPTAVLSMHTAYPEYMLHDFTPYLPEYIDSWAQRNLTFDGILTGFLGSEEQIEDVERFLQTFGGTDGQGERPRIVVDPVMGDHGKIYTSYTQTMCKAMRRLVPYADVVTPNVTELCELTDASYDEIMGDFEKAGIRESTWTMLCRKLSDMGPKVVVVTGLPQEEQILNLVYRREEDRLTVIASKRVGQERCGTGDIFSSVLAGSFVHGASVEEAVALAARFVSVAAETTQDFGVDPKEGLCFEECLSMLTEIRTDHSELFDVRTPDGEVTGMVMSREDAHRYGYLHGTVHLWIWRPSQDATGVDVLLQRRCEEKESYPGCLDISSAGHISAGQVPEDAVLRELYEELGLQVALTDLTYLGTHTGYSSGHFHGKVFRNHELSYVYAYEKDLDPQTLSPDPVEVSEVCWLPGSVISEAVKNRAPGYCLYETEWNMVLEAVTRSASIGGKK
ncbi:MAG: pyridoxamine kinase [Lachnospiraceae bacterium]|nr:pyridoxamine kinase [Lachnospiraceae bacterium]